MASNMETYYGQVSSTRDAILIFEACRLGLLTRVQRRLSDQERKQIRSGSIYVWEEGEAGMQRWTDSKIWGPSRVSGPFLMYREMETRSPGSGGVPSTAAVASSSSNPASGHRGALSETGVNLERFLEVPGGLVKQSYSQTITSTGSRLHLICYYSSVASALHVLTQPTQDPVFSHIVIPPGLYPEPTLATNEPGRSNQSFNIRRNPGPATAYQAHAATYPPVAPHYPFPDTSLPTLDPRAAAMIGHLPTDQIYQTMTPFGTPNAYGNSYPGHPSTYTLGAVRAYDGSMSPSINPMVAGQVSAIPFGPLPSAPSFGSHTSQPAHLLGPEVRRPRDAPSQSAGLHPLPAVNHLISTIDQEQHRANTPSRQNSDPAPRHRDEDKSALRRLDRNFRG